MVENTAAWLSLQLGFQSTQSIPREVHDHWLDAFLCSTSQKPCDLLATIHSYGLGKDLLRPLRMDCVQRSP